MVVLNLTQLSVLKHQTGGGGGNTDATKDRFHQSLECVRVTFLYKEQSFDYQRTVSQGGSRDKSDMKLKQLRVF